MTVSNTNTKLTYAGNGTVRTFGITFPLLSAAHLRVIVTDEDGTEKEITANYTLSAALNSVTYPTVESDLPPLGIGKKITLLRRTPLTQEIDLQTAHTLDAEELERGYDKLTLAMQEAAEEIDRAIKFPVGTASAQTDARAYLKTIETAVETAAAQGAAAQTAATNAAASAASASQAADNADQYKTAAANSASTAAAASTNAQAAKNSAEAAANTATQKAAQLTTHNTDTAAHADIRTALDGKQPALPSGTAGQVLTKTADGVAWTDAQGGSGGSVTVDDALSSDSENPVQNKVVKAALDGKQPALPSGTSGQILTKTADGVAWADAQGGGGSVTVDGALSSDSENPVQNKVIKTALDEKQNTLVPGTNIAIKNNVINANFDTSGLIAKTERGAANGVASLDASAKVPLSQMPDLSETYIPVTKKGTAGGVAALDENGKVPETMLPEISSGGGKALGEVFYSQSNNAEDNPGALPLFTGETIDNFDNIYSDFYAWLQEHTALTCTAEAYEAALAEYGECPFYALKTEDVYGPGVNIATKENAVSSGEANFQSGYLDYPFDGEAAGPNGTNYWSAMGQGDAGDTFVGCYLGNINLTQKVTTIKMAQGIWASSGVSSVKVQYSPDNGTTWQDLQTYDTPLQSTWGDYTVLELPDYSPAATYGLRVMVVSEPANIRSWWVYELQFLTAGQKIGTQISVRLPLLKNYVKMAAAEAGITQSKAGLPNITGALGYMQSTYVNPYASGAFEFENYAERPDAANGASNSSGVNLDASRSSVVYGASDTVTPAHTTLYPWVSVYNAAVPASTAQTAEFQQALSGKADIGLTNIASNIDYVVESYSDNDGNWYRVWKSKRVEQGGITALIPSGTGITITFLKEFANNSYTIISTPYGAYSATGMANNPVTQKLTTSFNQASGSTPNASFSWYACGQGAE